jgi:hypothetical protein
MPGRTGPRPDTETARAGGRVAALSRWGADPDELAAARRELRAAKLAEHVQAVVATFPPLTPQQIERVVTILRGVATHSTVSTDAPGSTDSTQSVATHSADDAATDSTEGAK